MAEINQLISYLLFLLLGIAPSFIWLAFYLRKDTNPEPNRMVLRIFLWGALVTIPVYFLQLGFKSVSNSLPFAPPTNFTLYLFLGIALVEELGKFLVVRWKVFSDSALDEPVDLLLYMIIAALGFAALENILVLLGLGLSSPLNNVLAVSALRFVGATFLHVLSSGLFGYFLAMANFDLAKRHLYTLTGFILATLLHGTFNYYILTTHGILKFGVPMVLFISTALFLSFGITKLKQRKAVCYIKI